jgi:tetratricopeptide (TPR) repeat protein
MIEQQVLQEQLEIACEILAVLEKRAAGYTVLDIPASLQIELNRKREEVSSIETRLATLTNSSTKLILNNLPRKPSIFVGREEEVIRCLDALDPKDRGWGVIIDGIGGIGKTDLAREVAHRACEGGWFDAYLFATAKTTWLSSEGVREETLSLSSLDAFVREFARLLGNEAILQTHDSKQRRRELLNALYGRRTLLIFDNLETLTSEERNLIAEFLRVLPAPNKAIITSRYRTGESAITIRLDRLSKNEALKLMTEVGNRHPRVSEALNCSEPSTKISLYEAVGGSPLALTWILGLVAQKGYSLADAFDRLQSIDQSQDLYSFLFNEAVRELDEKDKSILSALSVFQTPTNINALSDATGLNRTKVQLSLEKLVTLSLVNDLEEASYILHPLTRNYVRAALSSEEESEHISLDDVALDTAARRRALRYWLDYARRYGGDHQAVYQTFKDLENEWVNLEANTITLRELSGIPGKIKDREAARMLIDISDALRTFLLCRGYWDERVLLSEWAYQAAQALGFWRDAGWAAYSVAWIHINRSEIDRATVWADRTAEAMAKGGDRHDQAVVRHLRGRVALDRMDFIESERFYTEALAIYREMGEQTDVAIVFNDLGVVVSELQDYERAESYYKQALKIHEDRDETAYQPAIFGNLGDLALRQGHTSNARTCYERQLQLAEEISRRDLVANAKTGLALVLEAEGNYPEALKLGKEALKICTQLRHRSLRRIYQLIDSLNKKLNLQQESD